MTLSPALSQGRGSKYDAIVVGAGPAGSTAALRLARAGLSVAIVEKVAFPRRKVCGEYISGTTWPLFRDLGLADALVPLAGPPVRRVGLFARDAMVTAPMPAARGGDAWGHALGRDRLDTILLEHALDAGAHAWQPWTVREIRRSDAGYAVTLSGSRRETRELRGRIVVAAHGSWERAPSGEASSPPPGEGDLIGFKAHFNGASLAPGLMPLVLFPGGYGGMVHGDGGRVSFSCCIRRDALRRCREEHPGLAAGEAVIAHVAETCRGVREALAGARREAAWLSAGPIRPGVRPLAQGGLFALGNAAGEAHPLVAEGISMAIQSGWLLGECVTAGGLSDIALEAAGARYREQWRRHFAARVRASSLFASLMLSPATAAVAIGLLRRAPAVLTWGAWWSGKSHALTAEEASA